MERVHEQQVEESKARLDTGTKQLQSRMTALLEKYDGEDSNKARREMYHKLALYWYESETKKLVNDEEKQQLLLKEQHSKTAVEHKKEHLRFMQNLAAERHGAGGFARPTGASPFDSEEPGSQTSNKESPQPSLVTDSDRELSTVPPLSTQAEELRHRGGNTSQSPALHPQQSQRRVSSHMVSPPTPCLCRG